LFVKLIVPLFTPVVEDIPPAFIFTMELLVKKFIIEVIFAVVLFIVPLLIIKGEKEGALGVLILNILLLRKVPELDILLAVQLNVPLLINFPMIKTPLVVFNVHEADDFKTNTDEEIPPLVHVSELLTNIESVPAIVPARSKLLNE